MPQGGNGVKPNPTIDYFPGEFTPVAQFTELEHPPDEDEELPSFPLAEAFAGAEKDGRQQLDALHQLLFSTICRKR